MWGLGCEYVGASRLNWFMKRAWLTPDVSGGGLTCYGRGDGRVVGGGSFFTLLLLGSSN